MCFGEWYQKYVGKDGATIFPPEILWYGAAQFGVASRLILKNSINYYINIRDTLLTNNPVTAHYCERSWYYIFDVPNAKILYKNVAIQDIHSDETTFLENLFNANDYKVSSFKYFEHEKPNNSDLLVLAANHLALEYINHKPYVLNVVGAIQLNDINYLIQHKNFRGFISTSSEIHNQVVKKGLKSIFIIKKYPYRNEMIQLKGDYSYITSIITNYREYSQEYIYYGTHAQKEFEKLKLKNSNIRIFGDPEKVNDVEKILQSRYILHIKYWGHVCNIVVKALALGVPVIMDRCTYDIGKYEAYVRHGENGMIFDTTDEIDEFINNDTEMYDKLKETCMKEAIKYHFDYEKQEMF